MSSRIINLADGVVPAVQAALKVLAKPGAVLLVPTETVYGLVCRYDDAAAVERIYNLKDRDHSKKLAAFVGHYQQAAELGAILTGWPEQLAKKYCPGQITIIAPSNTGETIGFRIPDHPFILALLTAFKGILASTSANASGRPNVLTVQTALDELRGDVDLAIDGGALNPDALASTVVLAVGDEPKILRQGALKVAWQAT